MRPLIVLVLVLVVIGQVLADSRLYLVKEGETLADILRAKNYGRTYAELLPFIDEIVQTNPAVFANGNANFVIPGSTIALPRNPNQPEPEPVVEPEPIAEPVPGPEPVLEPEVPTIGQLRASAGRTEIQRADQTIAVNGVAKLYASDVIFTRQDALAEIRLLDDTRILMGPESEFTVSNFRYTEPHSQGGNALGSLVASIRNGVIRTISGLIGKFSENEFQVNSTLTATIGIRGTDFTVRSCNQVATCGDLYGVAVAVQDGSISLKNQVAEVELKANEFAQVQSAIEAPALAPLPEGFFDLRRDVSEIRVTRSWWQKTIDYIKYLF